MFKPKQPDAETIAAGLALYTDGGGNRTAVKRKAEPAQEEPAVVDYLSDEDLQVMDDQSRPAPLLKNQDVNHPHTAKPGVVQTSVFCVSLPEDLEKWNAIQAQVFRESNPTMALVEVVREFYAGQFFILATYHTISYTEA